MAPPGQPKWIPGHRLGTANVTYVLLARKGFRLSASKRAWIQRLNGSAPLYRADAIKFGWDDATGAIMLESIRDAAERSGTPWLVFGDDDTHFDIESIEEFARTTAPSDNVVYGNVYDNRINFPVSRMFIKEGCYRGDSDATFPLVGGWFTGGSGVLIPGPVASQLTKERIKGWSRAGRHCKCIDQPFGCAMNDLGIRQQHRPSLFLDSCLDCLAMPKRQRRIFSCHATTAFRRKNMIARHKGALDEEILRLQYDHFRFRRDERLSGKMGLEEVRPFVAALSTRALAQL